MASQLSKGEQTKQKILQTTIKLVAKRGFAEVSFQDIANECKLSQSAALHHFKSKDGLIEAVIHTMVKSNHQTVEKLTEPKDDACIRLFKYGKGNLLWAARSKPEAQILVLLYYLSCYDRTFNKILKKVLDRGRERIEELVWAGKREKVFHFTQKVETVSEMLQDALMGAMFFAVTAEKASINLKHLEEKWQTTAAVLTGYKA